MSKEVVVDAPARNLVGNGTTLKGEIDVVGDMRIDGTVVGTIRSNGKIVVGQNGFVDGTIQCKQADIAGRVKGKVIIEDLISLQASAQLEGELKTTKLFIQVGATFTGHCDMNNEKKDDVE